MTSTNVRISSVVAALVAAALVPWTVWLAQTLPATATAAHWSTAWVGLDVAETVGAAASAILLARRDPRADLALVATAAILLLDAWFDVTTATEVVTASIEAALLEVPLAVGALVLAGRATR